MRIAAYQFAVSGNIECNLSKIVDCVYKAANQKIDLVVFAECAITGYPPRDVSDSKSVDFKSLTNIYIKLQSIADETGVSFIVGTIAKDDENIYNRANLFQPHTDIEYYDKRALWGWDKDNFAQGINKGVFIIGGLKVGVRICFEVRFPEYFRELYIEKTDLNIVMFYDVSEIDDIDRYNMIKGHLQTRAIENVCQTLSVNSIAPYQTAPTALFDKSGRILSECERNQEGFMVYDLEKKVLDFGEKGRKEISDRLLNLHY